MYKLFLIPFLFFFVWNANSSETDTVIPLKEFHKIVITGNFNIKILHSDKNIADIQKIEKEVDLSNLVFEYEDGTLFIKFRGSFVEEVDLGMIIYIPQYLSAIEARRGAIIRIKNSGDFKNKVSYYVNNGSKILAKELTAPKVVAEISKGGSIQVYGTTQELEANVSMGGTIGVKHLKVPQVKAKVSMGGEIICAPGKELDAKVFSGGTISYVGDPKVKQKITFGGTIEQL